MIPIYRRISQSNTSRVVWMNNFHFILHPHDQELMHGGRHTLINMDPILAEYNIVISLHLGDEECGGQSLSSYCEFHAHYSFVLCPFFALESTKHHVGLHQCIIL